MGVRTLVSETEAAGLGNGRLPEISHQTRQTAGLGWKVRKQAESRVSRCQQADGSKADGIVGPKPRCRFLRRRKSSSSPASCRGLNQCKAMLNLRAK